MKFYPRQKEQPRKNASITVAVVTYNHWNHLYKCIDSIMEQDYDQMDLVIVDDCSCDFDQKALERYIYSQKNNLKNVTIEQMYEHRGPSVAYNRALELAKGEYILFIAGDDCLAEKDVLSQIAVDLEKSTVDVFQARARFMYTENKIVMPGDQSLDYVSSGKNFDLFRITIHQPFAQLLCIQSMFFRTEWLRDMGAFPEDYQYAIDWPVFVKMLYGDTKYSDNDLTVTLMRDGGAYRSYAVGNVYIRKGYLKEAARAIREFAIDARRPNIGEAEVLLLESAANAYECKAVQDLEWYHYSLSDKIAWRKENKHMFLTHKACYPDFGVKKISLKRAFFVMVAVFLLFIICTMLPEVITNISPKVAFVACVAVFCFEILFRQKPDIHKPLVIDYKRITFGLVVVSILAIAVRMNITLSVSYILLLILGLTGFIAVVDFIKRIVRKMICRYAGHKMRKG